MPALVVRRPWAAVVILIVIGWLAGVVVAPPTARAATTHRALVVVDTGSRVKHRCVGFSSDTITGSQAIDLADVQPVYSGYSASTAVCALCGTGCPADNCFCRRSPDLYWRYNRQAAGGSTVTYSSQGAGGTKVHDGDIEYWSWGQTSDPKPAPENIDRYCAPVTQATSTSALTANPQPPTGGSPNRGATGTAAPASATSTSSAGVTTTTAPTTDSVPTAAARGPGEASRATPAKTKQTPASSTTGIVTFALALTALVGAVLLARRARRRRDETPEP